MEIEFLANNSHLLTPSDFMRTDPHLRRMKQQKYVFHSSLIDELPTTLPGIYNLGGGRQVGKTTLLKQWMLSLMKSGVDPKAIAFLSCELIVDEKSLYRIVKNQLDEMPATGLLYLLLDEITYVKSWDKAIKYLADTGEFERVVVMIIGSDLTMMHDARMRFPGRRGKADKVDFHYYPLSFAEFLQLKKKFPRNYDPNTEPTKKVITEIYKEFDEYLIHGGFLTAINEFAMLGKIQAQTLATYSDWIRGDMLKRDKKESYLREVLGAMIKHYTSRISWREFVKALSIDHIQTAMDYVSLLESMDAVYIQAALLEDKLVAAPKKHKKFIFNDPFIYHAIQAWLNPVGNPYEDQIKKGLAEPVFASKIVEACVVSHFRRHYEKTFYISAEQEVDVAYVDGNKFWPIEVKWTQQLRPESLKQIQKYKNGQVWARVDAFHQVGDTVILPLPWVLLAL